MRKSQLVSKLGRGEKLTPAELIAVIYELIGWPLGPPMPLIQRLHD